MIKQIVDFSRNEEKRGAATIELFMMLAEPAEHEKAIKDLIADGAIIQTVDSDTIRAVYKATNQDKLLELIEDGWHFSGQEQEEAA